jgi:hypothetical protein
VAVQVWIGEKPEHPQERRAIVALANGLQRLDALYLILANFSVGGRNIDLVIIKQDGIFIIELKYCDGKVFGDVNGPWFVEGSNGERKRLNPGRKNPYNQVISYYYSLINFLNENRPRFVSSQKAASIDFRTCRRLVVIAPIIQEGSQVETDWKVDLKGLDELPAYLVTERSTEIDLTEEEMLAIPELLHCTDWSEINTVLASAVGHTAEEEIPAVAVVQQPVQPTPVVSTVAEPVVAARPRLREWVMGTWPGRAVLALSLVTIGLIVALTIALRPIPRPPTADQPGPMTASTSLPAGGADASSLTTVSCTWSGFQPVGRRRGVQPDTWETVGIDGVAQDLAPDVVVTLEEVAFCDGQIHITWSLRNNTNNTTVSLPLNAENISVRDSFGNLYPIAEGRPLEVRAEPLSKSQGTAVITQPINLSAATLVIQVKKLPFGEATWLVPVQGS